MECKDFIASAKASLKEYGSTKQEVDLRNAVSRAYYGAFHMACEAADSLALPVPKDASLGSHEAVIERLALSSDVQLKTESDLLLLAKRERNLADYRLMFVLEAGDVAVHVERCSKIHGRLALRQARLSSPA